MIISGWNKISTEQEKDIKLSKVPYDGKWVCVSEYGVTFFKDKHILKNRNTLIECEIYLDSDTGSNIVIHNNKTNEWFKGYIRERFVEPGVDNIQEMEEWFNLYSTPYTIPIGFDQFVYFDESNKSIRETVPTYYAIRMEDSNEYERIVNFIKLTFEGKDHNAEKL
jgi:hypothetical protein